MKSESRLNYKKYGFGFVTGCLVIGLKAEYDIFGNKNMGSPDLGAIETK